MFRDILICSPLFCNVASSSLDDGKQTATWGKSEIKIAHKAAEERELLILCASELPSEFHGFRFLADEFQKTNSDKVCRVMEELSNEKHRAARRQQTIDSKPNFKSHYDNLKVKFVN